MKPFLRRSLLLGMLALAACSSNKPKEVKARPVPKVPHPEWRIVADQSFHIGHGNGSEFVLLRPAFSARWMMAASADGWVAAYGRQHGRRHWRVALATALSSGVATGYGLVVVGARDGRLLALSADDGHRLWSAQLPAAPMSQPLVTAEHVFIACNDGSIEALDVKTGARQWVSASEVPSLTLRGMATPFLLDHALLQGAGNGRLLALDPDSGQLLWDTRVGDNEGRTEIERMNDVDGDLVMDADTLYVASYHGGLAAIDPQTGKHRWDYKISSWQPLARGLGSVYVVTENSSIEAIDTQTGKSVWRQNDLRGRHITAAVVVHGVLFVADDQGWVYALSQVDGHWLAKEHFYHTKGFLAPPAVDGDEVLVQGRSGRVISLHLQQVRP